MPSSLDNTKGEFSAEFESNINHLPLQAKAQSKVTAALNLSYRWDIPGDR
jgi:hypothetical protein